VAISATHREQGELTPERWQQVSRIFKSAILLGGETRAAYVASECGADESLRAEVEKLIESHGKADEGNFLGGVAVEYAAPFLVEDDEVGPPEKMLDKGQQFGSYMILDSLGAGGMGEVYLAHDTRLERTVALKVLSKEISLDKRRMQRFRQEAKVASSLNQPNILTVYEFGEVDGLTFIATEFVDGETLRHHLHHKKLKLGQMLDIAIQVLSALDAAHEARIVHRDIKPENVMIRRRDRVVKVLDFGLAKLTEKKTLTNAEESEAATAVKTAPGTIMGTVNYMSPEQAQAGDVDDRTDIWSTGVMIYEMVSGTMPFSGATSSHTIVHILEKHPPPLSQVAEIPAELDRIVMKAIAKNRDERYQTAKDMLIDLRALTKRLDLEAEIGRTSSPTMSAAAVATDEIDRGPKKKQALAIVLTGMALVTAAVFAVNIWRASRASNNAVVPTSTAAPAERILSYWITVQKFKDNKPYQDPFILAGEINFEATYQIRLSVRSPQAGHLYVLNEGPESARPGFVVLFPSPTANQGSSLLTAAQLVQIPEQSWFRFDEQQGVEKLWLVFSEEPVPELESVKEFANARTRGLITDPSQNSEVQNFLSSHSAKPEAEKGDTLTTLKTQGKLLVYPLRLEHH
jgi:serine/threonine protein kinase